MDFLVQQMQRIAQERAEMEARGETPPPLPKPLTDLLDPDRMMDDATDWVKDQFTTKEEKEAKSRKKREEIEERERKEREAKGPSLADMFSGFKFGSGRSPFYHMQGGMDDDQRERFYRAHPEMREVDAKLDAQVQQMREQDAA